MELRHVLDAFRTRCISDGGDDFVRAEVYDVRLPRGEMRGNQVVVIHIDREVVEAFARRPGQIELRHLLQRWAVRRGRELSTS